MYKKNRSSPGMMVAAAFLGPGTVVTCSLAGALYGYQLAWIVLVSAGIAIILQDLVLRTTIRNMRSLAMSVSDLTKNKYSILLMKVLILLAICFGNAAYQSGNLTGAALGVQSIVGLVNFELFLLVIPIAILASGALFLQNITSISFVLKTLVFLMSIFFVLTVFFLDLDYILLWQGLFGFSIPKDSGLIIISLLGTTIVPYNLFLHSSIVSNQNADLQFYRKDLIVSISIGALISLAILLTSAATLYPLNEKSISIGHLADQLRPSAGNFATLIFSLGIAAAGLSSAITAPLAAGIVAKEINGSKKHKSWVIGIVMMVGLAIASFGIKPLFLIQIAQFANSLILPFILFLIVALINSDPRQERKSRGIDIVLTILVGIVLLVLSSKAILSVFNLI